MADSTNTPTGAAVAPSEVRNAVNRQQQDVQPSAPVRPCGGPCWIEIELLDEDDRGVAREPYSVKLPNGQIREGKLNDQGWVRFDNIPCGICVVRFPRVDRQFIQPAETNPAGKTHWLEIVLLDEDKQPVAGAAYSVTLPDGGIQEGKLDKKGYARLNGLPPGTCLVRFPEIDKSDFVS
jgi:hypothetical protein